MLTAEQNQLVTSIGPATPAGEVLRHYWQPAVLAEELAGPRPAKAIELLGERLVVFRDEEGRYGLVARHCPHRGADLKYGRLEDGGLRCPFHGWLFDVNGACLEQPAEPPDSRFHTKIRHTAYPCREANGIVFAYMGPGDPPPLPDFDCFLAPDEYTFAFKGFVDCNWLQLLEVGIDPSHASFLHRFLEDESPDDNYGRQFRFETEDGGIPITKVLREYDCPDIDFEETEYGLRIFALRDIDEDHLHVRVTNMIFPNAVVIPMSNDMMLTQWHVPLDDCRSWWYAIFSSFSEKVDKETMRRDRLELYSVPDYMPRQNKSNDYGYNPEEQRTETYTGMGMDINVHDQWAVESLGTIQDRTREHLGSADKAIIANRRLLMKMIETIRNGGVPEVARQNGRPPLRGPVAIDTVASKEDWQADWREHARTRRAQSGWAPDPWA